MKGPYKRFEPRRETTAGFYRRAGFPGVIGAIDCTHVPITNPGGENGELFRNRKGYCSINVQVVCDDQARITNVVARWPGSTHDSSTVQYSITVSSTTVNFVRCWKKGTSMDT